MIDPTQTGVIATGSVWGDIAERFTSRKFLLSTAALAVASEALLTGKMGDQTYVFLVGTVLGIHAAGGIVDKKLNPGANN
jgi:hypothetical protein